MGQPNPKGQSKMTQEMSKTADRLDLITKPIRNIAWLVALAAGLWVQFLGPGLVSALQEASGSNALSYEMQVGFDQTNDRLSFIEDNMAPPKIINWIDDRPIGRCNETFCRKIHTFSRTPYGENCGLPSLTAEIKLSTGEKYPITSEFTAVEGTLLNARVIHDFNLGGFIPDGQHKYQFTLIYPDCEWSREPLPRYSPWFDLVVERS